jgi:hypothetical protein
MTALAILEEQLSLALDRVTRLKAYRDKVAEDLKAKQRVYDEAQSDVEKACQVLTELRELKEYIIAKRKADK